MERDLPDRNRSCNAEALYLSACSLAWFGKSCVKIRGINVLSIAAARTNGRGVVPPFENKIARAGVRT